MDWFTKAKISMKLTEWLPWMNVFKCARIVQNASSGGMGSITTRGVVLKKERAANLFGALVLSQETSPDAQNHVLKLSFEIYMPFCFVCLNKII